MKLAMATEKPQWGVSWITLCTVCIGPRNFFGIPENIQDSIEGKENVYFDNIS
jgi:hypothetical protein